jgi:hypothetical protein
VSEENVAIVKSSWAGWRQGLHAQMVRDFEQGVAERIAEWAESAGDPDLQPEEFIDNGDEILVRARPVGGEESLTFRYTMSGPRIAGWDVV